MFANIKKQSIIAILLIIIVCSTQIKLINAYSEPLDIGYTGYNERANAIILITIPFDIACKATSVFPAPEILRIASFLCCFIEPANERLM